MRLKKNENVTKTQWIILSIFPAMFFIAIIGFGIYTRTHPEDYRNKAVCMMFNEMKEKINKWFSHK